MKSTREEGLGDLGDPRVLLAAERTLLAWVRTGLATMGFGFVVARFGLSVQETTTTVPTPPGLSVWIGAALILLGVVANIVSIVQHRKTRNRWKRGESYLPSQWSLILITTGILAVLGFIMAVCLIFSVN